MRRPVDGVEFVDMAGAGLLEAGKGKSTSGELVKAVPEPQIGAAA